MKLINYYISDYKIFTFVMFPFFIEIWLFKINYESNDQMIKLLLFTLKYFLFMLKLNISSRKRRIYCRKFIDL